MLNFHLYILFNYLLLWIVVIVMAYSIKNTVNLMTNNVQVYINDNQDLDAGIAPFIIQLNQYGWKTNFSCSGMAADHPIINILDDKLPYIAFDFKDLPNKEQLLVLLLKAAKKTGWNCAWLGRDIYSPSIHLDTPRKKYTKEEKKLIDEYGKEQREMFGKMKPDKYTQKGRFIYKNLTDDLIREKLTAIVHMLIANGDMK